MTLTVTTQNYEKSPFLTFFILLGKNSSSTFGGTPVNYAWMDSSTITVSYLDSGNAQFCCSWKRALVSVAFRKK